MFRDTDAALKRLQEQLLEEEADTQTPENDEALLDETLVDTLLSDTDQGEAPRVYQNFSNDYGRQLRNYASGYKVYNTDKADLDLDSYSEAVRSPKKQDGIGFLLLVLGLMAAILGVLVWIYLKMGGILG